MKFKLTPVVSSFDFKGEADKRHCHIVNHKGNQYLVMPDGNIVPGVQVTRVTDKQDEIKYAIVKLMVNISEGELDEEPE